MTDHQPRIRIEKRAGDSDVGDLKLVTILGCW